MREKARIFRDAKPSSISESVFNSVKIRRAFLSLVFVGLFSIHLYVKASGPHYFGILLVADHLFDIAMTLSLFALYAGLGGLFLSVLGVHSLTALERLIIGVGLGSGIIGVATLMLGAFLGFDGVTIIFLLALSATLARTQLLTLPNVLQSAWSNVTTDTGYFPRTIVAIVAIFMISQALLPPTNWDSLMYHLRLPEQLLQNGRLFVPDDNLHMAFVQLVHMLYLPLLAVGSPVGTALFSVFFALLLGLAVFALAHRFFDSQTAAFSISLLWSSTIVVLVAITPRIDVTLSFFLFIAHFALLLATVEWKCFYVAAIVLGFAVGIKYSALIYAIALVPVVLWVSFSRKIGIVTAISNLVSFGGISIFVSLPWAVKNWWLFQAPLYPMFAQRKVDPWLAFLYPERVLPESIDRSILSMLGQVRLQFNLIDLFVDPRVLSIEVEGIFYRFSPLFLILILWAVSFYRKRSLNCLIIPGIFYLILVIAFSSRTNLRYLIPVIAPFTVASAYILISRVMNRFASKTGAIIALLFVLLLLFPTATMMKIWSLNKVGFGYLMGRSSYQNYLYHASFPPDYAVFAPIVEYINETLPQTSRVLMLFDARGYNLKVPVIQDNLLTNWPLLANRASKLNCLGGSGITHVLVNVGSMNYYLDRGLTPATVQWNIFREFADKCLTKVFEEPDHVLYQIKGLPVSINRMQGS